MGLWTHVPEANDSWKHQRDGQQFNWIQLCLCSLPGRLFLCSLRRWVMMWRSCLTFIFWLPKWTWEWVRWLVALSPSLCHSSCSCTTCYMLLGFPSWRLQHIHSSKHPTEVLQQMVRIFKKCKQMNGGRLDGGNKGRLSSSKKGFNVVLTQPVSQGELVIFGKKPLWHWGLTVEWPRSKKKKKKKQFCDMI